MHEEEWNCANRVWNSLSSPSEGTAIRIWKTVVGKRIENKTEVFGKLTEAGKKEAREKWNNISDKYKTAEQAHIICDAILYGKVEIEDSISFNRLTLEEKEKAKKMWNGVQNKTMEEANKICQQIPLERRLSGKGSADVFILSLSQRDMIKLDDIIFATVVGKGMPDKRVVARVNQSYRRLSEEIEKARPEFIKEEFDLGISLVTLLLALKENECLFDNKSFLEILGIENIKIDLDQLTQMEKVFLKAIESMRDEIFNLGNIQFHLDSKVSRQVISIIDEKASDQLVQSNIDTAQYFLNKVFTNRPELYDEIYLPGLEITALSIAVKVNTDNMSMKNSDVLSALKKNKINIGLRRLNQMEREFLEALGWDVRLPEIK